MNARSDPAGSQRQGKFSSALARSAGEIVGRRRVSGSPDDASQAADLQRLVDLHNRGAITNEEYAAAKRKLLFET